MTRLMFREQFYSMAFQEMIPMTKYLKYPLRYKSRIRTRCRKFLKRLLIWYCSFQTIIFVTPFSYFLGLMIFWNCENISKTAAWLCGKMLSSIKPTNKSSLLLYYFKFKWLIVGSESRSQYLVLIRRALCHYLDDHDERE